MSPVAIDPVSTGYQPVTARTAAPTASLGPTGTPTVPFAVQLSAALGAVSPGSAGEGAGVAVTGDTVVATAKQYLGVPYVWGGTSTSGLDCSGLVQLTFKDLGIDLPRVSRDQATVGTAVPSLNQARPGDLIAFGSPVDHIAIYVGDGKILEAPQPGQNVHITDIHRTPVAIRRIVEPGIGGDASVSGVAPVTSEYRSSAIVAAPELLSLLDPITLATAPRAIPLAALRAAAGAQSGAITATDVAAWRGFSASELTAAGLSGAVAHYADQFAAAEREFSLPAGLLAAVAQAESGGDAGAVSPAGAQGIMQLMPATARGLGVTDSFNAEQSIHGAAKLLSTDLQRYDGSVPLALAAYNAGPGAVAEYSGIPPYAETQRYVQTITDILARLA